MPGRQDEQYLVDGRFVGVKTSLLSLLRCNASMTSGQGRIALDLDDVRLRPVFDHIQDMLSIDNRSVTRRFPHRDS